MQIIKIGTLDVNIDDMTFGDLKALKQQLDQIPAGSPAPHADTHATDAGHPYELGKTYLVQTVTFNYWGQLIRITKNEILLENAQIVFDTGCMDPNKGSGFRDAEYVGTMIIGRGAVVGATQR